MQQVSSSTDAEENAIFEAQYHAWTGANYVDPKPEVGMGVTHLGWADKTPYTIVKVVSHRMLVLVSDKATRLDKNGQSQSQSYRYDHAQGGEKIKITKRKNGAWMEVGKEHGKFAIGYRRKYHSYEF